MKEVSGEHDEVRRQFPRFFNEFSESVEKIVLSLLKVILPIAKVGVGGVNKSYGLHRVFTP